MKIVKKITNRVVDILICILLLYIVGSIIFPTQTGNIIGYHFYSILTDSMNPVIPPGALVLSKKVDVDTRLEKGDIVTFNGKLFGEEYIYTHYLKKIEKDDTGKERYYTQGNTATEYDPYTTYRGDILGKYVFHVPYLGRVIEFLRSPFGLAEMAVIFLLLINQNIMGAYFEAQDRLTINITRKKKLSLRKVHIKQTEDSLTISGFLYNSSKEEDVEPCHIRIDLLDKDDQVIQTKEQELPKLEPKQRTPWECTSEHPKQVEDYRVTLAPLAPQLPTEETETPETPNTSNTSDTSNTDESNT